MVERRKILMSDKTIELKKGKVIVMDHHRHGLAYCPQCGTGVSDFFVIDEMVLVDSGTERPYYARINEIKRGDEGPYAIVFRSPQESAKVPLANLRKVDE